VHVCIVSQMSVIWSIDRAPDPFFHNLIWRSLNIVRACLENSYSAMFAWWRF
jgi:hypothetical protein